MLTFPESPTIGEEVVSDTRSWRWDGSVWASTNAWTSFSQGAGSDLDADKLDGQHGSYYAPLNAPAFTGKVTVTNTGDSSLVVTGSGGAYIQEWRDGTNTLLGYISPASGAYFRTGIYTNQIINNAGSAVARVQVWGTGTIVSTGTDANVALTVQNTGTTPSGNLTEWLDKNGSSLGYINSGGDLVFTNRSVYGAAARFTATASTAVPTIVKGAASQSANLQEWQDSTGSVLAKINNIGTVYGQALYSYGTIEASTYLGVGASPTTAQMALVRVTTAEKQGLIIRGASAQTANLLELQDSANAVLAKITKDGDVELTSSTRGVILTSPAGNRFRVTVDDDGSLVSTAVA